LSLDAEMAQRMLNTAAAFYIAAARCHGTVHTATTSYATHAPPIVCYAFSIELYLKLLILITTGKKARGHKLVNLYDKISDETRQHVIANWRFPGDPDLLRDWITDASEDFVQWRYAHGTNSSSRGPVNCMILDTRCTAPLMASGQSLSVVTATLAALRRFWLESSFYRARDHPPGTPLRYDESPAGWPALRLEATNLSIRGMEMAALSGASLRRQVPVGVP